MLLGNFMARPEVRDFLDRLLNVKVNELGEPRSGQLTMVRPCSHNHRKFCQHLIQVYQRPTHLIPLPPRHQMLIIPHNRLIRFRCFNSSNLVYHQLLTLRHSDSNPRLLPQNVY